MHAMNDGNFHTVLLLWWTFAPFISYWADKTIKYISALEYDYPFQSLNQNYFFLRIFIWSVIYMLWWWYFSSFFFKDCKQPNNIQSFGNDLLCNITDKCTEIICCLFLEKLELSLDFFLTMDPCNNKFTIGVGKLTKSEYLLSFQFGVEEVFSLFGVLKLRFVIICWFRILILCHKRIFYLKLDNTVPDI